MGMDSVRRVEQTPAFAMRPTAGNPGHSPSGSFQQQMDQQEREHYKARVAALFDEIAGAGSVILEPVDLNKFERYRGMIRELLREVVSHAYCLNSERMLDRFGRSRVYETVTIVDKKLEEIAGDLLRNSSDRIDYLGRMDEIRGLLMDLLY